ncbi:MAG: HEPN domain-containing protein [Sulfuricurvum sp.]
MNETSAKEWLTKAWHHLSTANLLYDLNHYSDIIAVEIHYSAEITLKSILAFENSKIVKIHDLIEIYKLIQHRVTLPECDLSFLDIINEYHIRESYPSPHRRLPSREEIKSMMVFTNNLFVDVCTILNISIEEIKVL